MGNNVSVGLLGLGVVGSGVIKLIEDHQEKLTHQLGCSVDVKGILVRNLEKHRDINVDRTFLTTNPDDVLNNPEIDIIVEVMGGVEEARKYILKAFAAKKHVVSANKDLVALYGPELQEAANRNKCDFYYEASVAGGIPILRGITEGLSSDHIQKVMGIVNGTTNYILTKMTKEGLSYETALKQAQELGFAEADPTSDVEGMDAARKMAILCRLAFSMEVDLNDVETKGISDIQLEDLHYGEQLGLTMKLIGYADFNNRKLDVNVGPTFLSGHHPLASVNNEYNAVYVYGEAVGETMFYGPGAGSLPTATAILSDVVSVIKNMRLGVTGYQFIEPHFSKELKTPSERFAQLYIRLHVKDEAGVLSKISTLFNESNISFKRILQNPLKENGKAEIVVVTHQTSLEEFLYAMNQLHELDEVIEIKSYYKVEGDAEE